ncbi:MAG: cold shock domain-containing protein [Bacteroidetes bacterium]|nr:cold shock domain-containing protein [Bacteroidota bacterium]
MARARETFGKKETRTKKDKKRKEKEQKRVVRKENKGTTSPDDMIAYVDEFGNITSTPPEKRTSVKLEDIELGAQKLTDPDPADLIHTGMVTFFDTTKGFGFIKDTSNKQGVFVHVNGLLEPIKENNQVTFEIVRGPKGLSAINVKLKRE